MKTCSKCGQSKTESEFHKDKKRRDGLDPRCKACHKAYHAAHSEQCTAISKAWKAAHPEQFKAYHRAYHRAYQAAHLEERKARAKARYAVHPEGRKARVKAWQSAHPEERNALRQARRAREVGADGCFSAQQWLDLKVTHNHTCPCCGRREPEVKLTADHVVPLARGGSNWIENIQPLCLSCNCSKSTKTVDYRPLQLKAAQSCGTSPGQSA
jgi:5-methylcytosine-specific restriction endonuclease McrA